MSCIIFTAVIFLCGGLLVTLVKAAEPALRVIKSSPAGSPLLRNGNFEQVQDGNLPGWQAAPQGFAIAPHEGRGGSTTLACENLPTKDGLGPARRWS